MLVLVLASSSLEVLVGVDVDADADADVVLVLVVVFVEVVESGLLDPVPLLPMRDARMPNSLVISLDGTSSSLSSS